MNSDNAPDFRGHIERDAASLVDNTLDRVRNTVLSVALESANRRGRSTVNSDDIKSALSKLGIRMSPKTDDRKRRRFILFFSFYAFIGAISIGAVILTNIKQGDSPSQPSFRPTLEFLSWGASAVSLLVALVALLISSRSYKRLQLGTDRSLNSEVLASEFMRTYATFEHKVKSTISDGEDDFLRMRPLGILVKAYARVLNLNESEIDEIRKIIGFRNKLAHGGIDDMTAVELENGIHLMQKYLSMS